MMSHNPVFHVFILLGLIPLHHRLVWGKALFSPRKSDGCGSLDWKPFGDSKCYKVVTPVERSSSRHGASLQTRRQAAELCSMEHEQGTLPSIESEKELQFIYSLLNGSTLGNIWLGAKEQNSELVWDDGLVSEYANWHEDNFHQTNHSNQCIQMESHRALRGKWTFTDCDHTFNFVICQKPQSWAPSRIQRVLQETRRQLSRRSIVQQASPVAVAPPSAQRLAAVESQISNVVSNIHSLRTVVDEVERLRQALMEATETIEDLNQRVTNNSDRIAAVTAAGSAVGVSRTAAATSNNGVPVGFVYIQYGGQAEPRMLWPSFTWTEITGNYAGMFFRAEGGQSGRFGIPQHDNSPRLTHVTYHDLENHPNEIDVRPGETSEAVRTGHWDSTLDKVGLVFTMSDGEVRPYNSAIKMWKRTG